MNVKSAPRKWPEHARVSDRVESKDLSVRRIGYLSMLLKLDFDATSGLAYGRIEN